MSSSTQRRTCFMSSLAGTLLLLPVLAVAQSRAANPRTPHECTTAAEAGNSQSDALVAAAASRAPELDMLMKSRESGLLTDWRIVGPFGRSPETDFDRTLGPEQDGLRKKSYSSRRVTYFQFSDGKVEVPQAQSSVGVYFAASKAELDNGGEWRIWVESPGTLEIFIDGVSVLRKDERAKQHPQVLWKMRRLDSGSHNVVVKFLPHALPFRVAIMPPTGGVKRKNSKPQLHAGPESEYVSVALRYWRGDHIDAARQLQRKASTPRYYRQ